MNKKQRYLIMLQLSSQQLNLYSYDTHGLSGIWKKISGFMKKHKFEKIKDTTFISNQPITYQYLSDTITELINNHPPLALGSNVIRCYSVDREINIDTILSFEKDLVAEIQALQQFPPGKNRGISSAQPLAAPSGSQRQPPAPPVPPVQQNPDTVTVSISELKGCFEADVELQVTVKKSDLEEAKKQAVAKKQSNTKSEDSEKSKEPPEQNKPNPNRKPKR